MTNDYFNKTEVIKKITPIIEKAVEDSNVSLLELNFVKESGKWYLRIFVYDTQKPVTHKECGDIARKLNDYLDEIIPVPYYMEISSPGLDRKLKSEKEYEIFKGKRIKIKIKKTSEEPAQVFWGEILDYREDEGLTIKKEKDNSTLKIKKENITYVKLEPKI